MAVQIDEKTEITVPLKTLISVVGFMWCPVGMCLPHRIKLPI